ncbi:hypothetical protein [Streptomyces sp. WMMB 322]|uniref:hypothetical protein n=1 Tax=Streptomyces sp. WMMB 322 TaxID=1286821 RepID=UPI0020C7CE9D|nr:hypothetical protein [Streptomyces sp. WMMB 322]
MPSAVLMGMGLTPQLASAKPLPKNPFKGGACVSQPDKDEDAEEKAREKAEKEAKERAEKEKAEKEKQRDEADGGSDSSEPGSGSSEPEPSPSGGSGGSGGSEDPEPSPSPSDPEEDEDGGGLLGGVGDAIGDILSPEEKAAEKKEEEEEKASSSPEPSTKADEPVGDAVEKVGDGLKDTTDKLGKGVEEAGKGAADKLPSAGEDEAGEENARKDGKDFPCVEAKKSAGKDEQTPNSLPNEPWQLKASSLGLHGLDYEGVVNIRTQDGRTKQALKFTASSLDIGDLHQIVKGPDGTNYHVQAAKGSTSTIRGGKVTMYTEELKGNLFGLIPIVFDPEHPPPLNIPEAYFTNVEVRQAGQFGGNLTVPGLHQSID